MSNPPGLLPGSFTGRTLGPFEIQNLIGEGSYGQVYRALDTRNGRMVALKILVNLPGTEGTKSKFNNVRETVLPPLRHLRVLQPLEAAQQTEEGFVYFATRLIEPGNLRDYLDRQKLVSWKQAARMLYSLADTLVAVHKQLIHQDLKPENILVDHRGTPYIIDLGFALLQNERHVLRHEAAGSWPYMAPEVFKRFHEDEFPGQALEPNEARADIYSLGLILYELLTGRYAFGDRHDFNGRLATIDSLPQSPEVERPEVPIGLANVCMRCLAPNPAERIRSAAELKAALDPFVTWRRVWRPSVAAAALVVMIVVASLAVAQRFVRSPETKTPDTSLADQAPSPSNKTDIAVAEKSPPPQPLLSPPPAPLVTLTVILTDAQTRPVARAHLEASSPRFELQGIKIPESTTDSAGEAQFKVPALEGTLVQFSASHPDYCGSRWNVQIDESRIIKHQLRSPRLVAVLDNDGAPTLILKTPGDGSLSHSIRSENQLGYAPAGTKATLIEPIVAPLPLPTRPVHVEILSGALRGSDGWVSPGVLKNMDHGCP